MNSAERRTEIEALLKERFEAISATSLAKKFSVSRQVIVGDIALMRASGYKISATPRGYIMDIENTNDEKTCTIACNHSLDNMKNELYAVVDNGGAVVDVTVEHPVYGQIVGELRIFSRFDADLFLKKIENNKAQPLSRLTGGIHLHTIEFKDEETLQRILDALKIENILLEQK
jgi:transcriptional regulator of NAD metabolism